MKTFYTLFLFLSLIYASSCQENFNINVTLPRPLIVDLHKKLPTSEDVVLYCTSWRFAVEANNLSPWKTIPQECKDYVADYMNKKGYESDLERVSKEAIVYASTVELKGDGKDIWVFDVDDTLLSNLPYYAHHGYGSEIFDGPAFDKWMEKGTSKAIKPSLKLYEEVIKLGFKVFLLTGRSESHRNITVENLIKSGFQNWEQVIVKGAKDQGKTAIQFKSERRGQMVKEGYRIHGNSGAQWSDLLGSPMSVRSFKLPNPMYYVA